MSQQQEGSEGEFREAMLQDIRNVAGSGIAVDPWAEGQRQAFFADLSADLPLLETMLDRYPVEVYGHGLRYVFCNMAEVRELIAANAESQPAPQPPYPRKASLGEPEKGQQYTCVHHKRGGIMSAPATRTAPWQADPRRLWSLQEMIEFYGSEFFFALFSVEEAKRAFETEMLADPKGELSEANKSYIYDRVHSMMECCEALHLEIPALQADFVLTYVEEGSVPCPHVLAVAQLDGLIMHVWTAIGDQRFAFVPEDRQRYFEEDNLFGLSHPMASTDQDIRDAGNAFAMGLHTACVFHSMRVAELGMRALARRLRVTVSENKRREKVEWVTWDTVITGIRNKVNARLRPTTKQTPPRSKALKTADGAYYNGLLSEIEGFKDIFRNEVMHVRRTYTKSEAESAMERVGAFMQRLTTRIHD